jgi:hypothetical protein
MKAESGTAEKKVRDFPANQFPQSQARGLPSESLHNMAKRAADDEDQVSKDARDRRRSHHEPNGRDEDDSGSDFEGEYEDEWDSDEEIIEAGADGLPDDEAEKQGTNMSPTLEDSSD